MPSPMTMFAIEAFDAACDMERALLAAAALLQHCTCQYERKTEALAASTMASNSIERFQAARRAMQRLSEASVPIPGGYKQ